MSSTTSTRQEWHQTSFDHLQRNMCLSSHLHHQCHSGVPCYISINGRDNAPSISHTTNGVPACSSSLTALGAAVKPIAPLHRRRRSSMVFFIDSTGGSSETPRSFPPPIVFQCGPLHRHHQGAGPHLLARLHRRWLPVAFINIDATRSGASPPRPSPPPTASRRFHLIDAMRSGTSPPRSSPLSTASWRFHQH